MIKSVKLGHLVAAAALAASASTAFAQAGYVQSPDGKVVMDPFGLCWRTSYWTPANANSDCDSDLAPKAVAAPAAPPRVAAPPPPPAGWPPAKPAGLRIVRK